MKSGLFIICLICAYTSSAQSVNSKNEAVHLIKNSEQCSGMDSAIRISGKWKKTSDDLAFPEKTYPSSQHKLLNSRVDSIYSIVKTALPDLKGFQPTWYRSIRGDSYMSNGAVPYALDCFFPEYYCNTNVKRVVLGDETSNWVYVFVNRASWFFYDVDTMRINDDGKVRTVYQLPPRVGKWGKYPIYQLKTLQPEFGFSRSIIIGRNGKMPWRTLTRKEYLTGLKRNFEANAARMKSGSSYDIEYRNKAKIIEDYLAVTSEEELSKPVVIDPKSGIWGFKGKWGDEDDGGFRLVLSAFNENYFDKNLPRHVPQFIQVYWSYGRSELSEKFRTQFEKNLDIEKLKAMMDK